MFHTKKSFIHFLCDCVRGKSVTNEDHECKINPNEEVRQLYDKSERRCNRKIMNDTGYNVKAHHKWADEKTKTLLTLEFTQMHFQEA